MLLAVEGGFFSASALGYSKFLSLVLFGQRNEQRPMKVLPWSQYHLEGQEVLAATQLASKKSTTSRRCTIFICFGSPSARQDGNSPPKVDSVPHSDFATSPSSAPEKGKNSNVPDITEQNGRKVFLKSSIKKPHLKLNAEENLDDAETIVTKNNGKREVHWTDTCGRELAEIREFEPSEDGPTDEESEPRCFRKCSCV